MPTPLPHKDRIKLHQVIRLTRDNVDAALEAHVAFGSINADQRADLKRAETDTAWLLAQLLDGPHYGALPWSTIKVIWDYALMASDLLEAHRLPALFEDTQERTGSGSYRVCRQLSDINGDVIVSKAFECKNPAVGIKKLDRWQARFELNRGAQS